MSTTVSFDDIKTKQHKVWSSGDYGRIAWVTVPLAETLVEAADLRPGVRVLDVATGTGHVAIAAARRFCDVTGIDYVPDLVDAARRRAAAEDLDIDFRVADAENLPFSEDSFDYVFSAIGVMFTADHQRAADELVRVVPAGRPHRDRELDTGRLRRPAAEDRRPARAAPAGRSAPHPLG